MQQLLRCWWFSVWFGRKHYLDTRDQRDPPVLGNPQECQVSGFSSYLAIGLGQVSQAVAQTWYPVVWAGAVTWFSPADLVLSFSSMFWKYKLFSRKLPWPDWDVKYFCQLNFQFVHGAGLLLMRMPRPVSLLFHLFNSLSFTVLQRALQQKGNTWTMQHEAKSFLYLKCFLKKILPGARHVQVGKVERHVCFFYWCLKVWGQLWGCLFFWWSIIVMDWGFWLTEFLLELCFSSLLKENFPCFE